MNNFFFNKDLLPLARDKSTFLFHPHTARTGGRTFREKVLSEAGLKSVLHANGTSIEGEWHEVFAAVHRCHEVVHQMGAPRIFTVMKLGTRTDRTQTMEEKTKSVETKLAAL